MSAEALYHPTPAVLVNGHWWVFLDGQPFGVFVYRWQADRVVELLEQHGVAEVPADASAITNYEGGRS